MGKRKKTVDDRFDDLLDEMQAKYPGKVLRGDEYTAPWMLRRLPTGILNLDIATNGGLPAGGMTMLVGKENIGKNWLAYQIIRKQQDIYGDEAKFAIIGTEMSFDKNQAKKAGVRIAYTQPEIDALDRARKMAGKPPLTQEETDWLRDQVGKFVIVPPETAESSYDKCEKMVAANVFNVILLDSFGSILTKEEDEKELDEVERMAGAAGLNTRFMRKLNAAFAPDKYGNPNLTCLLGTNQVRSNLKAQGKYDKQTIESGGWALKHGRFVTVELAHAAWIYRSKSDKTKIGRTVRWELTKQKAGGHGGQQGKYDLLFPSGVGSLKDFKDEDGSPSKRFVLETGATLKHDRAMMALDLALKHDLLQKSGNWIQMEGDNIGNGRNAAARYLVKKDILDDLEEEILQINGAFYMI